MRYACVAMVLACVSMAQAVPANYSMIWSDDFNGTNLDLTRWEYRALGPRRAGYNTTTAVAVQNGLLSIMTTYNAALNRYETGMIGTQPTFLQKYGYFEARMKLQTQQGHWSAFWLQSPDIQTAVTPPNPALYGCEVDIQEYRVSHPNGVQHALHWNGYSSGTKSYEYFTSPAGFAAQEWHTFGLLWTPTSYTFYVDGLATLTTATAVSQRSEYLILSVEIPLPGGEQSWVGGDITNVPLPDGIYVDYVRAYASNASLHSGDANRDNTVDVTDLGILATNYGNTYTNWTMGDFNGDGVVDVIDLGLLATGYGNAYADIGDMVPEPATLGLLTMGILGILRHKTRAEPLL
jgi:beta-glucanase (GH16 family)